MNANTKYIELNKGYAVVRLDNVGDETLITAYNVNVKDVDLLIEKLQGIKADYTSKPVTIPDEPPQMTAVLGAKPKPEDWYKNALQKNAAQPVMKTTAAPVVTEPLPPMPQRKRGKGIINVMSVTSKSSVRGGHTYEGQMYPYENADIVKNSWIRVYGLKTDQTRWDKETMRHVHYSTAFDRTFKMGDVVEYGSYNMSYTGKIVAIGEKTVKVEHSYGGKVTQLDLHTFIWRNWDLDLAKIAEDNANWSMTS